ncbi:MAG TPA: hypothetical protein VGM53_26335 [Streptosporangiaceae bacterium]
MLITNLVNRTQPLIRYELSDSVTLAACADPTGMPFRRITSVAGRSDDAITLPAPDGTTVTVHPLRLHTPFGAFPDVVQYQIAYDGQVGGRRHATTDHGRPGPGDRPRTGTRGQVQAHQAFPVTARRETVVACR